MTQRWKESAHFNVCGGDFGRDDGTQPIVQVIIAWSVILTVAFFAGCILTVIFAAIAEWVLLQLRW